ncbi:MAG: DUF2993 domain-containing protein [Elainellaceae cyanobacterium]
MSKSRLSPEDHSESSGSHVIQSVLTPAIRFWLGTQVDHAEELKIEIQSRDRQILKGHIPAIQLAADHICYQGLYLGRLEVSATNIRVNWWGIARGQSLQLLAPFPVEATMHLSEAELNRSLQVDLMAEALTELMAQDLFPLFDDDRENAEREPVDSGNTLDSGDLGTIDPIDPKHLDSKNADSKNSDQKNSTTHGDQEKVMLSDPSTPRIIQIALRTDALMMTVARTEGDRTLYRYLLTGLNLHNGHTLSFHQPQLLDHAEAVEGRSLPHLAERVIDFGETVELTDLHISPNLLRCHGTILAQP